MSAEIDLRCKIDATTHCALVAHARAHGIDKQDIVREVLGAWMLASCLRAKGEAGAAEGIARAAQGIAGQPGEMLTWDET